MRQAGDSPSSARYTGHGHFRQRSPRRRRRSRRPTVPLQRLHPDRPARCGRGYHAEAAPSTSKAQARRGSPTEVATISSSGPSRCRSNRIRAHVRGGLERLRLGSLPPRPLRPVRRDPVRGRRQARAAPVHALGTSTAGTTTAPRRWSTSPCRHRREGEPDRVRVHRLPGILVLDDPPQPPGAADQRQRRPDAVGQWYSRDDGYGSRYRFARRVIGKTLPMNGESLKITSCGRRTPRSPRSQASRPSTSWHMLRRWTPSPSECRTSRT